MANVNLAEWRILYERAIRIKELAPWTWMEEVQIFGVEDPISKTVAYVSISGALGEHVAVIAYVGESAIHRFWRLQAKDGDASSQEILEMRQIQASFEDRSYLETNDLATIRELGMRFRGSQAWPCFRSTYPGCVPWFFDADEARMMTHILEQTEDVVTRVKDDPTILREPGSGRCLVRRHGLGNHGPVWVDEKRDIPPPPTLQIPVRLTEEMIDNIRKHPQTNDVVEADLAMMLSTPVREGNARPYFPYALALVDGGSGMILSLDLLSPLPSLEEMWGDVIPSITSRLTGMGFIPGTIQVRTEIMEFLVKKLSKQVPLKVRRMESLPKLESALRALQGYAVKRPH